ncbi:unnamed protein product [Caenorhabditis angaria]|uniref:Uncharacterized protein n=1 Tax=Caenorhabditis angaria TaxID=860376 RepID=A0A9P1IWB5_9PELO|nr:unnamed protein product [Caenorhabditis angaria]
MYPFNRTTSIHADSHVEEEEDDSEEEIAGILENGNHHVYRNQIAETNTIISAEPKSPVEKTILASILELSDVNNKWVTTMRRSGKSGRNGMGQRESIFECSWRLA